MMASALAANDLFIVGDDEQMRDALAVVLTLAGYRVSAKLSRCCARPHACLCLA
jgi:FixJ family two-component response regulator